jgi:hypothetical protein
MADRNGHTGAVAAIALVATQLAPLQLPALVAIGVAPAAAQYGARSVRVSCYSNGNRTTTCNLPPDTQSVTFIGPDRSNRCREGETWRRRGNDLQVSNGCGGVFEAMVYQGSGNGGSWGGGGWGDGPGGNWGGNDQGFAGEITCRSRDNRQEQCYARTQNRVEMLQQYSQSPCIQGRTWSYNRNNIQVRNGCQARFGYGYGNWSGGGNGGNTGGNWGGSGFAGQTECRSENNRYQRCSANTRGRVEMLRQLSSTSCVQGRNWGYDNRSIWVDNGCQARFGYGYGNVSGDSNGGGSNTGAVIGGVALAAGLIALLAAAGKSGGSSRMAAAATSATLDADIGRFPSDARPEARACLDEAARQVGSTGGTRLKLESVDTVQRSGEGWMILARMTGT